MVYGMETPQIGMGMEKAMGGILKEVGDQEGEDQLNDIRQLLHPQLEVGQSDPSKEEFGRLLGDHAKELNEQMADHKIKQVGSPFFVKLALLPVFGEHHFNGNKDHGHQQQVEQ